MSAGSRRQAYRLAERLGCTLEYQRRRCKQVDISLPKATQVFGNPGLDALHHECELDEDIWPGVVQELEGLQLEPLSAEDE